MAIKRVRKSVSLQKEVIERGQEIADKFFNGNFSIYITHLINNDYFKINDNQLIVEKKEEINQEAKDTMDSILDM